MAEDVDRQSTGGLRLQCVTEAFRPGRAGRHTQRVPGRTLGYKAKRCLLDQGIEERLQVVRLEGSVYSLEMKQPALFEQAQIEAPEIIRQRRSSRPDRVDLDQEIWVDGLSGCDEHLTSSGG
jgi:hypothetical protein